MNIPHLQPTLPNELYVVGEHVDDPLLLLLQGTDGNYYAYDLPEGKTEPVEVDDRWQLESTIGRGFVE